MAVSSLKKTDILPALIWLLMGLFVAAESYRLGIGYFRDPGPGMMPFILGLLLIFVAMLLACSSLRGAQKEWRKEMVGWREVNFWRIGFVLVVLFAYGWLLERVGFSVTSFIALFFLFKATALFKARKALGITLVTVFLAYCLFIVLLKVHVPSFPWRNLW